MSPIFDFTFVELLEKNPFTLVYLFVKYGGWFFIVLVLIWGTNEVWKYWRQNRFAETRKTILLAIDIPKGNEQTPKAVENIFSQFAGAHGSQTFWESWYKGEFQETISLEIISIDGYVQFVIQCHEMLRDLIEASIYAQYPDAEITEIKDYVEAIPANWPNDKYDMFGLEYVFHLPEVYPIRTYEAFEDKISGTFKDPMAGLLEILGSLRKGEQVWYQLVLEPIDDQWVNKAEPIINKIIGKKEPAKESKLVKLIEAPIKLIVFLADQILWAGDEVTKQDRPKDEPPTLMMHLTPGEKDTVTAIQRKTSKIGFRTKFRILYIGEKKVFNKARGVGAVIGATKQFNTVDLNRFKPAKRVWTKASYLYKKQRIHDRQRKILEAYKFRSNWRGAGPGFVLNIEELATLWHFPVLEVKAPLVKKTESKRGEPPFSLPETDEYVPVRSGVMEAVTPFRPPSESEVTEIFGETSALPLAEEERESSLEERMSLSNKYIEEKLAKKPPVEDKTEDATPGNLPFIE